MSKRMIATVLCALVVGVLLSWFLQDLTFTGSEAKGSSTEVTSSSGPQRVICMSPAVTEIVFALGQGDRVVGVSQSSEYPPEAREKQDCGGFINPNAEMLVSLRPDLIITQGAAADLTDFARAHDIEILSLGLTDLDSIVSSIEEAGKALDCGPEAERLCAAMRLELARVSARVAGMRKPRVLLVIGPVSDSLKNLLTVGSGNFLNDVLEVSGGQNIFSDLSYDYPMVSMESLMERAPEVIVELRGEGKVAPEEVARTKAMWSAMPALPAVRDGRVYVVGSTYALIPGPRIAGLADELAAVLHPTEGR